jgi:hypothetical protein
MGRSSEAKFETGSLIMPLQPDCTILQAVESYIEQHPDDAEDIRQLHQRALAFLVEQSWLRRADEILVAAIFPGVLGIFLAKVVVDFNEKRESIWLFVGDIPPAYIAASSCQTPAAALEGYLGEMQAWIDAVRSGESTEHLIPVNAAETSDAADALEKRLDFLQERILPLLKAPAR